MDRTTPAQPAAPTPRVPQSDVPRWAPSARELDDLEVLLLGGYAPLRGFLPPEDVASVLARAQLCDGIPWPVPITLVVPGDVASAAATAGVLVLIDEEGTPVGELVVERTWTLGGGRSGVAGPVLPARPLERGSHRSLRQATIVAAGSCPGPVLGVPLDRPLLPPHLVALRERARTLDARILLLPLTGSGSPRGVDGPALVRSCLRMVEQSDVEVIPVAVPRHDGDERESVLRMRVAAAYGATHVPASATLLPGRHPGERSPTVVELPAVALDLRTGTWQLTAKVPAEHRALDGAGKAERLVAHLVARGEPVPPLLTGEPVARELGRVSGCGAGRGFTVLFTGLSGSGKSTIAKAVHAALLQTTDRPVTLLDGDVVRSMLSSELDFSRAHRDLNVRRIGYVAAEITRHGGIALCAPIAPYAPTRAAVRAMVEEFGGFLLVHVSTPLEVCEARDRKGLYAKARAGLLAEFTGVSDPYEDPTDADLTIDTAKTALDDAVEQVLAAATTRGWLTALPLVGRTQPE